jgi:hypothetical protein
MMGEDDARGGAEGGVRWETYPAGAALLGMKVESFRRLAFRKAWRRTPGNDGLARVAIPLAEVEQRLAGPLRDSAIPGSADIPPDARGGTTVAEPPDSLTAELRRRAEAAESRAERAKDERDGLAAEIIKERERRAQAEGELAGLRVAFEQALGRAEGGERERDAARDTAARAEREVSTLREALARETRRAEQTETLARQNNQTAATRLMALEAERKRLQAAVETAAKAKQEDLERERRQLEQGNAARQAAETARDIAAAAAEAARAELAELTAGGPLRRALRAFAFRRGRP